VLYPVFLSGGVGSRLWPISRELHPKQFLPLMHESTSMLQQTVERLDGLSLARPVVVCNDEHRFLVAEQLRQQAGEAPTIILEPEGRNTAPAVAVAAVHILQQDPDAVLLVLPADHVIDNVDAFCQAVMEGLELAQEGSLVTFGVVPASAETGYGYIKRSEQVCGGGFAIDSFVEKPDQATAESYVEQGNYYWNSGMFLLRGADFLAELESFAPAIATASRASYSESSSDLDFIRLNREQFLASPSDSIDYAVMEHTRRGVVIPLDAGWSDVGAWSALWECSTQDKAGNVVRGDIEMEGVSNSYLHSESRLVAAIGVYNIVVVETPDAVLVAQRDKVHDVKQIVNRLKSQGRSEVQAHTRVYRPWGSYESLVQDGRFQVKRIIVNPGQALSLQMHHHRAEHWIVVHGTAAVTCGDEEMLLGEDQSTYIPLGNKHRLRNPGVIPLELIEVQTGTYLGEDDITRFDDVYGR
jgi:mannose-1-phosphate guanylyltransferase/mannose-6-phosphate isomerase